MQYQAHAIIDKLPLAEGLVATLVGNNPHACTNSALRREQVARLTPWLCTDTLVPADRTEISAGQTLPRRCCTTDSWESMHARAAQGSVIRLQAATHLTEPIRRPQEAPDSKRKAVYEGAGPVEQRNHR